MKRTGLLSYTHIYIQFIFMTGCRTRMYNDEISHNIIFESNVSSCMVISTHCCYVFCYYISFTVYTCIHLRLSPIGWTKSIKGEWKCHVCATIPSSSIRLFVAVSRLGIYCCMVYISVPVQDLVDFVASLVWKR